MTKKDSKIITSEEEFDSLDIEIGNQDSVPTIEEVTSLDEIDISLDETDETTKVPPVDDDVEELKNKVPKPKEPEIEIDITSEDIETVKSKSPSETPVKKKRGKKAAEPKTEDLNIEIKIELEDEATIQKEIDRDVAAPVVEEKIQASTGTTIYDPNFTIKNIKMDKYQTRATNRTPEDLNELVYKIKLQGQLEPVHLVKQGNDYQLLAGFGRINALKYLHRATAKAIIYEGISEAEIFRISTGTNLARLDFSEWDKIVSIGNFMKNNPDFNTKESSACLLELSKVFGFHPKQIYKFLTFYHYFNKNPGYHDLFNNIRVPGHVIRTIYKYRDDIMKHGDVILWIKEHADSIGTEREFEYSVQEIVTNQKIKNKIENEDIVVEGIDDQPISKKAEENQMKKLINDINKNPELLSEEKESQKQAVVLMGELNEHLIQIENKLVSLINIDRFKAYLKADDLTKFSRSVNAIAKLQIKLI